ncbi:MAG: DUF222 domain-containing protein [Actinomycetota bacterium]
MFWSTRSATQMRERLREVEAQLSDLHCEQAVLVNELDKVNIDGAEGHRSMVDWLSAELDVTRQNATDMVFAARHLARYRPVNNRLAEGDITFDRAVAVMRLADAGADRTTLDHSESLDLAGVGRLTARQRRVTRNDEHDIFAGRFVSIQPTLDESSWRLSGQLPAVEGRIVEQALCGRADQLRLLPGGETCTRAQRQADALVVMAQDSLDQKTDEAREAVRSTVTVFVDLGQANGSGGELGATVEYGPRVGPNTLEELLCTGTVQIIGLEQGRPVVTSKALRQIPPAVRRLVAHRDGGCTIAGCTSRYRLQPHHIRYRADGGSHDPENLTTLCWFHHHIAVHQQGLHIDPNSPPQKRRLLRTPVGADPP